MDALLKVPSGVQAYYALGHEQRRLDRGQGRLEELRTHELLRRWIPKPPAVVLDVGGAAGRYALALSGHGYEVHLVDLSPVHVRQAEVASAAVAHPLASVSQGDARRLAFDDACADVVLLLGPLYHLPDPADRGLVLEEAARVLRPGGVVVAAAISRWASALDGVAAGFLREPEWAEVVARDVATGVHENPTGRPDWFTTAYFHRPDELREELAAAGLAVDGPVAVEGVAHMAPDIDALLDDAATRDRLLAVIRSTEREPALLGATGHLLAAGQRPS
ncbi:class I SAM-dependent methyltransferase [Cellulosimicrobium cellulans]|uniref:class I SAM-dependent methyltransferase n=1 Tax=Cellulosimicrobium cellulans TaxID=1710 RepID=UPI00130EA575|nr:class I SAM-dependent methyltransferase [Cellulosimicrobium cellulans]